MAGPDGSWILQPDPLILPLNFGLPALGASATALGQPRSASTSSGYRYQHGTRPTEQGSPLASGFRVTVIRLNFPFLCTLSIKDLGFPNGPVVKNLPANAEDAKDAALIPGWERSPGIGNSYLLQYPCLENSLDRGTWWATAHGVTKSWTQLSTHMHARTKDLSCHLPASPSLAVGFLSFCHYAKPATDRHRLQRRKYWLRVCPLISYFKCSQIILIHVFTKKKVFIFQRYVPK